MKELVIVRQGVKLLPRDQTSFDAMMLIPPGVDVMAKVWQPRNLKQHKFMIGICRLVLENSDRFKTVDDVLRELKILTDHYDIQARVDTSTGEITQFVVLKSLSFYAMDQVAFAEWFRFKGLPAILTHLLPGVREEELLSMMKEVL